MDETPVGKKRRPVERPGAVFCFSPLFMARLDRVIQLARGCCKRQSFSVAKGGGFLKKLTRRALLLGTGAAAAVSATRYFSAESVPPGLPFPSLENATAGTVLNDASLLSPTTIAKHIIIRETRRDPLVESLRAELNEAKAAKRPLAISAARHSMGAQSLAKSGTAITLEQDWLEPDSAAGTYRVAAGMRWGQVIARLDKLGFSPKVMQSNNDFAVASTFAVNAHGWPVPFSAFGSTVRSLTLLRPDGELVSCSRTQNSDLFCMTMGGYGLTGAIVELEAEMVPNARLRPTFEIMRAEEFSTRLVTALKSEPKVQMAYGRLNMDLRAFLDEALLITYRSADDQENLPAASPPGLLANMSRPIFRNQLESDRGKSLRWYMETKIGPLIGGGEVTRNSLLNEPVATLDDGDPTRTDILQEYFISPERFAEFVQACRDVISSSYQQLLNVTLRYVEMDKDSVLAYATERRIAAVMLFSQEMTVRAEEDMARMTSALIERTLAIGGTYYLPYRLHATTEQFQRAYVRAAEFVSRKRALDPQLTFRNALWDRYLGKI